MIETSAPDVCDVTARWMFFRALRASRLFTDQEVDAFIADHPAHTLSQVKAVLVGDGILTPYQLDRIAARDTDGLVVGQYHLQAELGRGGFGVVYHARHALMNRPVALKVIGEQWSRDPVGREIFLREVAGCTRLSHPNIAMPYDAGEVNGRLYLAMEYVDGPTLDAYVTARGPLDSPALVAVLAQTAEALRHAAERGVIHRDLKPANILLASRSSNAGAADGLPFTIKVIDFGLARFFHSAAEPSSVGTLMCEAGAIVGTPSYMPPEQVTDFHAADVRSDLYSLGCTIYQAATGQLPFTGRNTQQVLDAAAVGRATPVSQFRSDIPTWLVDVINTLMARRPEERFQTPEDLIDVLCAHTLQDARQQPLLESRTAPVEPTPPDVVDLSPSDAVPNLDAEIKATNVEPVEDFTPWWQEWHRQLGRLAGGQRADLSDHEYRTLHRTLLRSVRQATAGPAAEYRPRLVAAIEPWVSLRSLTVLDRRTLGDVWAECQRLTAVVGPGRRRFGRSWWS